MLEKEKKEVLPICHGKEREVRKFLTFLSMIFVVKPFWNSQIYSKIIYIYFNSGSLHDAFSFVQWNTVKILLLQEKLRIILILQMIQLRPRELCGDLIVSGHTLTIFTAFFSFKYYAPKKLKIINHSNENLLHSKPHNLTLGFFSTFKFVRKKTTVTLRNTSNKLHRGHISFLFIYFVTY
uniref:PAP2_C domain-containing protein n=1 Tax=Heterorhabditis bacteriophora TaxID=37862 RepID=A0A1I7X6G3_HETBA